MRLTIQTVSYSLTTLRTTIRHSLNYVAMDTLRSSTMTKTSKPIVFFGSGPVAAKSLELLAKDFSIEAVITKPRPAHHRGEVPVLDLAAKLQLPIHLSLIHI